MGMVLTLKQADFYQFSGLRDDVDALEAFMYAERKLGRLEFDCDQAWQALHFLLTGKAWGGDLPIAMLLNDYAETTARLAYGPCWFVPPEVIREFGKAAGAISIQDLRARYDAKAMKRAKVYLARQFASEGASALEYILHGLPALIRFAKSCARRGEGAIGGIL